MTKGVARKGFDLDLAFGEMAEGKLRDILEATGSKVEVKCDDGFRDYGNVFIEYEYRGQPSGIATTEAQWWAIEFCDDCYLVISTERLKRWFKYYRDQGAKYHKEVAGDQGRSKGVAIPLIAWGGDPGLMGHLKREDLDAFGTTRRK
ncbi:unnamed protein product [marine sediment metagenome]|uniref:Uncharacterized protein n=1 Tax=marine sediment metagenome TaxID=412755 RepID=X1F6K1_9ZZZZ